MIDIQHGTLFSSSLHIQDEIQNELARIRLESFGSPKLQNLYRDIVFDIVMIHYHIEVVGEEGKITQMISDHCTAGIDIVHQVNSSQ